MVGVLAHTTSKHLLWRQKEEHNLSLFKGGEGGKPPSPPLMVKSDRTPPPSQGGRCVSRHGQLILIDINDTYLLKCDSSNISLVTWTKKSKYSLYKQVHIFLVQVTTLMLLESHFKRYVSFMSIKINWPCLLTPLPPWLGGGVLSD